MRNFQYPLLLMLATAGFPAQAAENEESATLQSYSVGDRRDRIEHEKVVIEPPKFENNFKMEMAKPTMGAMQIAKPNLEIVTGPSSPQATANTPVTAPKSTPQRTASAGSAPATTPPPSSGGETRAVVPLKMEAPAYPREAYLRREEGFVVVEFTINAQGATEDITVVEAEPRNTFDREAQRAVARWSFQPALRDGRPVSQRIRHTLEFTLD